MVTPLNVLVIDEHPNNIEPALQMLTQAGFTVEWQCVGNEADFIKALISSPDVIVSEYILSHFSAVKALHILEANSLNIPFIVVTANDDKAAMVECMTHGALEYILKDHLVLLGYAVQHALDGKKLRYQLDKEKELTELKERFSYMITHEFRTPLTVINGASDLLINYREKFSPERQTHYLKQIQSQVGYMMTLLNDVMTYSRIQAGQITFKPEHFDLEDFCRTLLDQFQLTETSKHQFIFHYQRESKTAILDENCLRHILTNLLSNAVKYSPHGGQIELDISDEAHITKHGAEQNIVICVTDHGIGIPLEDQPRLFESFHRARNAARINGTGLGLAIVKQNVDMHGGTIEFVSQETIGTTFTVKLPNRVSY